MVKVVFGGLHQMWERTTTEKKTSECKKCPIKSVAVKASDKKRKKKWKLKKWRNEKPRGFSWSNSNTGVKSKSELEAVKFAVINLFTVSFISLYLHSAKDDHG